MWLSFVDWQELLRIIKSENLTFWWATLKNSSIMRIIIYLEFLHPLRCQTCQLPFAQCRTSHLLGKVSLTRCTPLQDLIQKLRCRVSSQFPPSSLDWKRRLDASSLRCCSRQLSRNTFVDSPGVLRCLDTSKRHCWSATCSDGNCRKSSPARISQVSRRARCKCCRDCSRCRWTERRWARATDSERVDGRQWRLEHVLC